jgi:hypothetical protein
MSLLSGDLGDLDLKQNLELLRTVVRDAGEAPLEPLLAMLASREPAVLADLVCGPKSPGGARLIRAAFSQVDVLEKMLSPRGLYPRLVDMSAEVAPEVLQLAIDRHPTAGWLVALSRKVEGPLAGSMHLLSTLENPAFAQLCHAHAEAGHLKALAFVAVSSGRCEALAALFGVDPDLTLRTTGELLDHWPSAPVVPYLAELWGPEPDLLVLRLLSRLRSRAAAQELLLQCQQLPRSRAMLELLLRSMPERAPDPEDLPT